ncbi:MAG: glycosyltransferase family 4 protein [archaeon]
MKVLMFGWEFPPHSRGGLGTACYGLTKGLSKKGTEVIFVVPKGKRADEASHVNLIITENLYIDNNKICIKKIESLLQSYMTSDEYSSTLKEISSSGLGSRDSVDLSTIYGRNLFEEVERYAQKAKVIASFEEFNVIHSHDWMTYKAGILAKKVSGKPLVVHVHATEFDRTGGHPNQQVYDVEREGMHAADKIIAVSNFTKEMIVKHYGINPDKVKVVHNGIYPEGHKQSESKFTGTEKIVLFLGRITLQKGPDYFIEAAKKVSDIMPDVKFVVAGTGDMYGKMIEKAADLGLGKKVLFTGHLTGDDIAKAYRMADLYVMPSVSEPFGITPLESINHGTPVLISKQSGVNEVLANSLKVDFWDIDEMTNKIVTTLSYRNMAHALADNGREELKKLTWDQSAEKCINVYKECMGS